jgi:hypothetical protein
MASKPSTRRVHPKTLAVMDQAFAAIWAITGPILNANDTSLNCRGQKLRTWWPME